MNPVIKAQLRAFVKMNSVEAEKESSQFELYSIFSVITGFLGESIDAYDVYLPGDEFGLDGVAVIIQGEAVRNEREAEEKLASIINPNVEFIFFQAKTGTGYDYGDVSKFYDAVVGFFDGDLEGESAEIDDCIGAMRAIYKTGVGKRNPRISCYYITTGNYESPKKIENLRSKFVTQLSDLNIFDNDSIRVDFVGARELQQWYRAATSSVEVEIEFPRNVVLPANEHVEEAYIGYIDARNLMKLCTNTDQTGNVVGLNRSVFFDNIRDYDPRSKINDSIKTTVRNGGGREFVFRNNGITVVSKNIDRTGDRFRLEDFQVVNGCQSTNIIFELIYGPEGAGGDNTLADSIQVPFRLIGSKDDEFVSSIIVGTNRQNPVRDEQFWALRPFMKNFEEYCRSLPDEEVIYFERRDNQYRNQDIERTRLMQPATLMKAIAAALLRQPQRAARDYRGILADYENYIFLDDHDVRLYHAVAYMYYRLEFLWRNKRIDNSYKTFRYYILAGIGLIATQGKDAFSVKQNKIPDIVGEFMRLCSNEDQMQGLVVRIVGIVEARLTDMDVVGQERIRDTIRSETFAEKFKERILAEFAIQ